MILKRWPFLLPVGALAAVFAASISFGTFVQAGDNSRSQSLIQLELQGSRCLARTQSVLLDIQSFDAKGNSSYARLDRDSTHFETAGCGALSNAWAPIASRLHAVSDWGQRQHLASAMSGVFNSIGDNSNITYDSNPTILNLGDAIAYALPEAETMLFRAVTARTSVEAAKLEATSTAQLSTAKYDIDAAIVQDPSHTILIHEQLGRMLSSANKYSLLLDAWETDPAAHRASRAALRAAMRAVLGDIDVLYTSVQEALERKLLVERSALEERLHILWLVYATALLTAAFIAWLIASSIVRREKRAHLNVQREASRLRAEVARDRAELALGIREARFQAIFAGSPLAIAVTDLHGVIVECNDAYFRFIGSAMIEQNQTKLLQPLRVEPDGALAELYSRFDQSAEDTRQVDLLLTDASGKHRWCHAKASLIRGTMVGAAAHCAVMLQDTTDDKERERHLKYQAAHDALTGLPNRAFAMNSLRTHLEHSSATVPRFAVLFIDVDDFKAINDTLGHRAGDDCLKTIAVRLTSVVREVDVVTRYGGDEFVVILLDPSSIANARDVSRRIANAFVSPLVLGDAVVMISLSVGVMLDSNGCNSAEQALLEADAAMYDEKRRSPKRLATINGSR